MSDPNWPDDDGVESPEEWLRDAGLLDDEDPYEEADEAPAVPLPPTPIVVDPPVEPEPEPEPEPAEPPRVETDDTAAVVDDTEPGTTETAAAAPRRQHSRRRRERQRRRRRARRRLLLGVAALLGFVAVGAAAFGVARLWPDATPSAGVVAQPTPTATAVTAARPEQDTLLLVRQASDDGPAAGITLLATSDEPDGNAIIFLPEGTLVDIPGFGVDRLGLAQQYGGAALVEASVENLLGIDIDHSAAVSNSGLAAFLARTGGLDLPVEERLVNRRDDGTAEVRFQPGDQFLDGERLVEYWQFRQRGESELDTFLRQQLVWMALLRAAQDPDVADALVAGGVPQFDTSADGDFFRSVIDGLATAQQEGNLDYTVLPVSPFGAEEGDSGITYRPSPEGIRQLIAGPLAPSVPSGGGTEAIRVQVLNGVGTPGIGQEVDRRLEGAGFRIVVTDNARSFDFEDTRILVYREDEESMEAAREVQRRLGVGTIQISRQPQSVVDLTIVVGADFTAGESGDKPFSTEEQSS